MARILVSGSVAYDRIMDFNGNFTEHIIPSKLHSLSVSFQVPRVVENFGGCAGNLAYNLALLGHKPSIIATVGSDFERYQQHLLDHAIDIETIINDPSEFTSVAHIVTDRAGNQIAAFALGAGGKAYGEMPSMRGYDAVIIAAGCIADTLALARAAKEQGIAYYFDPGQSLPALSADALRELIEGSAGLFGNDYETGLIEQKTGWGEDELRAKAPLLVVTLGARGSRILTAKDETTVEATEAEAVDPTGAGDAHRAGFVAGIVQGLSLKESGQLGSCVAAYAVEHQGTQNHSFLKSDLAARYEKAYGQRLAL